MRRLMPVTLWSFAIIMLIFGYGTLGGLTIAGLRTPAYQAVTLGMFTLLMLIWVLMRLAPSTWKHWKHYVTPLNMLIPLWLLLIIASWVFNGGITRRGLIAGAYTALYFGLLLILIDLLANRKLTPQSLIDGLLVGSLPTLVFGILEIFGTVTAGEWRTLFAESRISAGLDNPNPLGAYLVMLICLGCGAWLRLRNRFLRVMLALYLLVAAVLLVCSGSRGAWLSLAVAALILGIILIMREPRLAGLRASVRKRLTFRTAVIVLVIVVIAAVGLRVSGINLPVYRVGTIFSRLTLYQAALTMFAESPLTGVGFNNYGRNLMRLSSIPPYENAYLPHNAPLSIMAELGLGGAILLVISLVWIARYGLRRWAESTTPAAQIIRASAGLTLVAIAVHHLVDQPVMFSPIVACAALIPLVLWIQPNQHTGEPMQEAPSRRRAFYPLLAAGLMVTALVLGWLNYFPYRRYIEILVMPHTAENAATLIKAYESLRADDPSMPIYALAEGNLIGETALNTQAPTTSKPAHEAARAALEVFLVAEPYYAPAWANLAAIEWDMGDTAKAIQTVKRACDLASDSVIFQYQLATYLEASQDLGANAAWVEALRRDPDSYVVISGTDSHSRQGLALPAKATTISRALISLLAGDDQQAQRDLSQLTIPERTHPATAFLTWWLALKQGDVAAMAQAEATIQANADNPEGQIWNDLRALWQAKRDNTAGTAEQIAARFAALREQADNVAVDARIDAISYGTYKVAGPGVLYLRSVPRFNVSPWLIRLLTEEQLP